MSERLNQNIRELLPEPTAPASNEAMTAAMQQEALERGDRQLPDEPDRGFRITRLEQETSPGPVAVEAALPLSFRSRHKAQEINRYAVEQVTDKLGRGDMELEPVMSLLSVPARGLRLKLDFPIRASDYEAAVQAGHLKPGLFNEEGKASLVGELDANPLQDLVDGEQKRTVIEEAVTDKVAYAKGALVDELGDLNSLEIGEVHTLTEAYELADGEHTVRLLNLSGVPMQEAQLRQTVNAVRSSADKSGGGVYDRLRTIAILPEEHPLLRVNIVREDGQTDTIPAGGLYRGRSIFLSGRLVKDPKDRPPLPATKGKTLFERFGLPGESEEGPHSPRKSVGAQDLEPTLAHELEHAALPKQHHAELPGPAPSLYGRSNTDEHISEIGAALYMGGAYAAEVPANQRLATGEMWNNYRGTTGTTYNQPVGPRFVECRELDVAHGPLPSRVDQQDRQVLAEISYHLIPDAGQVSRNLGSLTTAGIVTK